MVTSRVSSGEGAWPVGRSRSMELTALAVVNGVNAVVMGSLLLLLHLLGKNSTGGAGSSLPGYLLNLTNFAAQVQPPALVQCEMALAIIFRCWTLLSALSKASVQRRLMNSLASMSVLASMSCMEIQPLPYVEEGDLGEGAVGAVEAFHFGVVIAQVGAVGYVGVASDVVVVLWVHGVACEEEWSILHGDAGQFVQAVHRCASLSAAFGGVDGPGAVVFR